MKMLCKIVIVIERCVILCVRIMNELSAPALYVCIEFIQ